MTWPEVEVTTLSPFTFVVDLSQFSLPNKTTLMLTVDELAQDGPSACGLITVQVPQPILSPMLVTRVRPGPDPIVVYSASIEATQEFQPIRQLKESHDQSDWLKFQRSFN